MKLRMTPIKKCPPALAGAVTGRNLEPPNHITFANAFEGDGFTCSLCGELFPWCMFDGWNRPLRYCTTCASLLDLLRDGVDNPLDGGHR